MLKVRFTISSKFKHRPDEAGFSCVECELENKRAEVARPEILDASVLAEAHPWVSGRSRIASRCGYPEADVRNDRVGGGRTVRLYARIVRIAPNPAIRAAAASRHSEWRLFGNAFPAVCAPHERARVQFRQIGRSLRHERRCAGESPSGAFRTAARNLILTVTGFAPVDECISPGQAALTPASAELG